METPTNNPITPLLLSAVEAAQLCNVGERTWWRYHAAKRVPAPVPFGRRPLWRRAELERWIEAGTPDRQTWEKMKHLAGIGRR